MQILSKFELAKDGLVLRLGIAENKSRRAKKADKSKMKQIGWVITEKFWLEPGPLVELDFGTGAFFGSWQELDFGEPARNQAQVLTLYW